IIELKLPSFFDNFDPRAVASNFPSGIQAYLAGLTFAFGFFSLQYTCSCFSFGYVAASRDPVIGGSLLLTYTIGYVSPLLLQLHLLVLYRVCFRFASSRHGLIL
ncbi:hypothetical protein HPP92_028009, partial [Vanilla planifolia]